MASRSRAAITRGSLRKMRPNRSQLTGFPLPLENLRCPMLLITNSLRPNTTKLSLLSSDQVMETHTRPRQVYGTRAVQAAIHDVPLLCEVQAARLPFVI